MIAAFSRRGTRTITVSGKKGQAHSKNCVKQFAREKGIQQRLADGGALRSIALIWLVPDPRIERAIGERREG